MVSYTHSRETKMFHHAVLVKDHETSFFGRALKARIVDVDGTAQDVSFIKVPSRYDDEPPCFLAYWSSETEHVNFGCAALGPQGTIVTWFGYTSVTNLIRHISCEDSLSEMGVGDTAKWLRMARK